MIKRSDQRRKAMTDVTKLKPAVIKKSVLVKRWTDDLTCPKCLRTQDKDEMPYEPFHMIHLEDTDILMMTCKLCGYNWLMETADAE
jgi:predicted nucleic-acid-binding Zn-ribbon protein